MPAGKPAGVRCYNLADDLRCNLWGADNYPGVCHRFSPSFEVCGDSKTEALHLIGELERMTRGT
jgi:uncharacterized protein